MLYLFFFLCSNTENSYCAKADPKKQIQQKRKQSPTQCPISPFKQPDLDAIDGIPGFGQKSPRATLQAEQKKRFLELQKLYDSSQQKHNPQ